MHQVLRLRGGSAESETSEDAGGLGDFVVILKNARSLTIHCSIQIKCSSNARQMLVPLQIFARKMLREFLITSIFRAIYEVSRAEKQQIAMKKTKNLH